MPSRKDISAIDGGPGRAPPEDLWAWLSSEAVERKNDTALAAYHQPHDHLACLLPDSALAKTSHFSWTFGELLNAVERLASFLHSKGVCEGDVVVTHVSNEFAAVWVLLLWTSWRLGATFVPIEPSMLGQHDTLRQMHARLKPKVLVVESASAARSWADAGVEELEGMVRFTCGDEAGVVRSHQKEREIAEQHWIHFSDVPPLRPDQAAPFPTNDPNRPILIMFTSGSTGVPKGCVHTLPSMFAQIEGYHAWPGSHSSAASRYLSISMLHRPTCYLGCLSAWTVGARAVFASSTFDPGAVAAVVQKGNITHTIMVPTQLKALMKEYEQNKAGSHELSLVVVTADMIDRDLLKKAGQIIPTKRMYPCWGMSEGAPLFGFADEDVTTTENWPCDENNIVALGRALPGTKVWICDTASSELRIMPRGQRGEVHVSSSSSIRHYLGDVASDAFYEDDEGRWLRTGDLAVLDDDDMFYNVGRLKDVISCKGVGIWPIGWQNYLRDAFDVEILILGVPHEELGEIPTAIVKSLPDSSSGSNIEKDMQDGIRSTFGPEFPLGHVFSLKDLGLEDWPQNSSGKVDKLRIKEACLNVSAQ